MANSFPGTFYQIFVFALLVLWLFVSKLDAETGICYGMYGDNLPPPAEVVALCKQNNIRRLRLYNPDPEILQALQGSDIEVILGVLNEDIQNIGASQDIANQWVQKNVRAFSNVKFKYITVGNEVNRESSFSINGSNVLPAMQNIYNLVKPMGIKVSTVFDTTVLGTSYPPSTGSFQDGFVPFIRPIIDFLVSNNLPICVDVYPYYAQANDPNVPLDFALGTSEKVVIQDGPYCYFTLFDAIVDSLYSALEKVGGESVDIVVTETGWTTNGGVSTTIENARIYNSKIVSHVLGGTPKRPGKAIETYIFSMFDENLKTPIFEQNWGVFLPNKQPKYPINFN